MERIRGDRHTIRRGYSSRGRAAAAGGPLHRARRWVMTSEQETISVFVVDDHEVVRRGIASFLEFADGITFVGEASDGREALDRIAVLSAQDQLPDVVLLDLQMPRLDGA